MREGQASTTTCCQSPPQEHPRRVSEASQAHLAAAAAVVVAVAAIVWHDACVAEIESATSELCGPGTWPIGCAGFGHKARLRASDPLGSSPPLSSVYATTRLFNSSLAYPSDSYA